MITKTLGVSVALVAALGCNKKKDEAPAPTPKAVETAPATTPEAAKTVEAAKTPEAAKPDPKLVERGAYIAKAGACAVCHTAVGPTGPDMANAFGGGLEMPDKMGKWITPNISQDKSTGIGGWTDDQIARGIREGVRPDNSQMYVIMPYMHYNRLTDDDTKALVAFLRTIPAVNKVVAPNKDLKMPKIPAPKPASLPDSPDDPKHGEYMATLMLCGHCHWTPGKDMAMSPDKMFSGGLPIEVPMLGTGTIFTRNITSDPETGIGKWTEDQIFTTIKTMTKPDGKMIQGPMLFMQGAWSQLDDKDLHAVAKFIKALPPVKNKVPDSTFKPSAGGPPPADGAGSGSAPPAKKG
jgi:cytochrome c553